ncbi:MAG: dUTP diphosphatase [Candidatus Woesearchaeota archaeon]|nr:dUTP diphosphatase [Candidatus Woesearchaeota archaeon]
MVDVAILKMYPEMTTPHYAHEGDAGIDLRSSEETAILPGETKTVATGVKMAIPQGFVGLVWDKSGYASKNSIKTMAGVIDSGYRGEIKVVMINLGKEGFKITKDMKIAQILIQPVTRANLILKDNLDDTIRGEGGFGSTGKN